MDKKRKPAKTRSERILSLSRSENLEPERESDLLNSNVPLSKDIIMDENLKLGPNLPNSDPGSDLSNSNQLKDSLSNDRIMKENMEPGSDLRNFEYGSDLPNSNQIEEALSNDIIMTGDTVTLVNPAERSESDLLINELQREAALLPECDNVLKTPNFVDLRNFENVVSLNLGQDTYNINTDGSFTIFLQDGNERTSQQTNEIELSSDNVTGINAPDNEFMEIGADNIAQTMTTNNCDEEMGAEEPQAMMDTEEKSFVRKDDDGPKDTENECGEEIEEEQPTESTSKRNIKKRRNQISRKEKARITFKEKHPLREPCKNCSKKCVEFISESRRIEIHRQYWEMSWIEQRSFIMNSSYRIPVSRRTVSDIQSQRNFTFIFQLKQDNGKQIKVCKTFFLATLGYHKKNDKVIFNVLHKTAAGALTPEQDGRGKNSPPNKIDRYEILRHVDTFHPNISHYRREHAPRVKYLPSDISISFMHKDFIQKFPQHKCSYEAYRKILFHENIRFTKLGHEECENCETMDLHDHDKENPDPTCGQCEKWKEHINKAEKARSLYRKHAEVESDAKTVCVSADLEKIIMLPRMETFKKVLFTTRLVAYNETFVPLGIKKSKIKPIAYLWHEAISGRGKEEIISTFYQFFLHHRDTENFIFWLDNCAAQNKNWAFMSFLVYIVNSSKVAAKSVEVYYFEPGHTFMSADSIHHQIELSLKRQKKTYDFPDFVRAVEQSNSKKIIAQPMNYSDFYNFKDYSAPTKRNGGKGSRKVFLSDIVHVKTIRGSFDLEYKCDLLNETTESLNFIKNDILKKKVIPDPLSLDGPCGITEEKKNNIIKNLLDLMDNTRKDFWLNLPLKK